MRYVAAYVLAYLGGNQNPDAAAIKKILSSVGVDCDDKRVDMVVDACKGHKLEDVITKGMTKLATVPSGGGAAPAAGAAAGGGAGDHGKADESKKPAKKEEEEEEDEDMGLDLFG